MQITRHQARIGYAALAAADSYLASRPGKAARRVRFVTKPLLMPALAAATHLGARGRSDGLVLGTQVAQLFSWKGDVALLGTSRLSFLRGVGGFFVAHVAYIAAFSSARDPRASLSDPGPRIAAATWVATAPVMAIGAGRKDPTLRVPITAYASILSAMFASSTTLRRSLPPRARREIVAGTSLFLLSDSLLGIQKFFLDRPSPPLEAAVMATYTAGQWFIADGVVAADA
jgi:uncharacterized membrane protein YhhN